MDLIQYLVDGNILLDTYTLRQLTGLPKMTLQRRLDAIEREYLTVVYQTRKLYHVRILEAFGITMIPQKDATLKNESYE